MITKKEKNEKEEKIRSDYDHLKNFINDFEKGKKEGVSIDLLFVPELEEAYEIFNNLSDDSKRALNRIFKIIWQL